MAELEDNGWKTWPNAISATRGLMAFAIPPLVKKKRVKTAAGVFLLAAATDWVDGKIAKTVPGQSSDIGKVIDPYIDKLLTVSALATLGHETKDPQIKAALAAVIAREVAVFFAKRSKAKSVGKVESAAEAGRFSMVAQSAATTLLFVRAMRPYDYQKREVANAALWLGVGASLASGWAYVADAIQASKSRKE